MTEQRIKAILDNYEVLKQYLRTVIDDYPMSIELMGYDDKMLYVEYITPKYPGIVQQMYIPLDWFSLSHNLLKEAVAKLPRKTSNE